MKGSLALAIISISFTPIWIAVLLLKMEDMYIALATVIEVGAIGMFSLGASETLDHILHPQQH